MPIRPWPKLDIRPCEDPRIFRLQTERFQSPRTGQPLDATILEGPDWVNVLPLTEAGEVVLVRQYRFGTEAVTLEVPGGAVDAGEAPLDAARRELREETGFTSPEWEPLGQVAPNPAFMRNRLHCFVARGCTATHPLQLDAGEDIEVVRLPLADVRARLSDGRIDHSLVMAIFLRFELLTSSTWRP